MQNNMKEKTIVSALTLIGSLATYYYAKEQNKDVVPYVMVGGFVGAITGELIAKAFIKDENSNDNNNSK
jgi:uncharacterized membrane protein YeaQ/YmgE (transglycosylase-associated protein family)